MALKFVFNPFTGSFDTISETTNPVTAAAVIADNALVRGDGGARGVQGSGISIDDSDNMTGVNSIAGLIIGTDIQAWDTDLDAIAGLAPVNDDIIQRKAGAWANRTLAQYKADLAIDHTADISNVGSNTHAQIDTHIANTSNPHSVTAAQLSLVIGTDVQAWNAILDDLSGLTQATNKIPYFDSATTAALLDFLDEDNMASDSATALASQQSIKAYVDNSTPTISLTRNFAFMGS